MRLLAIETSCDDTGIAVLECNKNTQPKLLADFVSSQVKIHAPWGGVVPMLAEREHQRNLVPLLKQALVENKLLKNQKSKIKNQNNNSKLKIVKTILERELDLLKDVFVFLKKYEKPEIDAIAVTIGPGLEPALWVGVNLARALSYFWNLPIIPVNHIEGHLAAALAVSGQSRRIFNFQFSIFNKNIHLPAIALIVSGGHTQLILVKKFGQYKIVGETRDDAAGEAFDKVAKMLGLRYPGGPTIAKLASQWNDQFPMTNFQTNTKSKKSKSQTNHLITKSLSPFSFPRPMINSGDFDFSFSGLKTAVLYTLQKMAKAKIKQLTPAIAAEFQQAVIDVLTTKTLAAAKKYHARSILLGGGVAANEALRQELTQESTRAGLIFSAPPVNFCTDNAAMIALVAVYQHQTKSTKKSTWHNLKAQANLRIS